MGVVEEGGSGPVAAPTAALVPSNGAAPSGRPTLISGLLQLLNLQERRGNFSRCGAAPLSASERVAVERQMQERLASERSGLALLGGAVAVGAASLSMMGTAKPASASATPARLAPIITVDTYIHVVSKGSGLYNGEVPQSQLDAQMQALNAAYSSCRIAFKMVSRLRRPGCGQAAGCWLCRGHACAQCSSLLGWTCRPGPARRLLSCCVQVRTFRYRNSTWAGMTTGSVEERQLKTAARKGCVVSGLALACCCDGPGAPAWHTCASDQALATAALWQQQQQQQQQPTRSPGNAEARNRPVC
jgi:hypothetical protein